MKNKLLLTILLTFLHYFSFGQVLTQTVRGTVVDMISQAPLPGATVVVLGVEPIIGTAADIDGNFRLNKVPVGTRSLKISFLGYKERVLPNITVTSGKEVVLQVTLEENVVQGKEVTIVAQVEKDKPLNEFSTVSARTFSVEETQKYAAAVNDPARMSLAYAGVVATDDGNNNIAIRGNSPNGLLWRMEGVEIPNPNHFSNVGTSGGGISILSAQTLTNSDFMTGAFPAEYGNANSGVFDLKLRKGNNQKTERTIQAGFLGTDLAIEGPFKKGYNGSYLINYRYSTLSMLGALGVPVGDAITNFQDISYNVFLPTEKAGNFSLFGFGGLSNQNFDAKKDSSAWKNNYDRYSWNFRSNTGAAGLTHFLQLDSKTYLRSVFLVAGTGKGYEEERLDDEYAAVSQGELVYDQHRVTLSTSLTRKINAQHSYKTGIIANELFYDFLNTDRKDEEDRIVTVIDQKGQATLLQGYGQWNYKPSERVTINAGLHALTLTTNKTYSIEPRASVKVDIRPGQAISFGYGLHGQVQPLGVYYSRQYTSDGTYTEPNKDLGFTKSHHFVLGYDRSLNEFTRVKAEVYAQFLYNVPVGTEANSTYSMLNSEGGFTDKELRNSGLGRNYGFELTVERFLHKDFYFLLSSSVYDSKYKAQDGRWYDTRFNGNFAGSFTAGKEFRTGEKFKKRIVGVNLKAIYTGGLRNTPIDVPASVAAGETKYQEDRPFTLQAPNYFRTDVKFSLKRNREKSSVTWSLDLQNATNRKNVFGDYFDPKTGTTKTAYQMTMIPVLSYKVDF